MIGRFERVNEERVAREGKVDARLVKSALHAKAVEELKQRVDEDLQVEIGEHISVEVKDYTQ